MSVENLTIAAPALQTPGDSHDEVALQHHLSPIVEALLTNVVKRLRASWLAGPALLWGDIHPISIVAPGEADQRVAVALRESFFQFSSLLAGFEILVLELEKTGVVSEQSILHLEQRFVESGCFLRKQVEVSNSSDGLGHVPGNAE